MALRITPMRPIERNGLKGFGFSVFIDKSPETANEIHERPSTNDEAYLEAGPQAEASLAGTGSRMLADREGRSEGEAASACLPTYPHSSADLLPSETDKAGEDGTPPTSSPVTPTGEA